MVLPLINKVMHAIIAIIVVVMSNTEVKLIR